MRWRKPELKRADGHTEAFAQAVDRGGVHGVLIAEGLIEPLYPGVKSLGAFHQKLHRRIKYSERAGIGYFLRRRQAAVAAQLKFAHIPGQIGPLI